MDFVQIRSYDNYIEANIHLTFLQDQGINCHIKDEYTITIDPLLSPMLGGMKLMVYKTQVERAKSLLEEAEVEYIKTVPCPACGQKELEIVVKVKHQKKFWRSLLFYLVNGQARIEKKFYRCKNCGKSFDVLHNPIQES